MMVRKRAGFHKGGSELDADSERRVQGIGELIAPTVRWMAAQHRAVLRQALGPDAHRIISLLEDATVGLEATVARRLETRLPEVIRDEIRRAYVDALKGAEDMPVDFGGGSGDTLGTEGVSGELVRGLEAPGFETEDVNERSHLDRGAQTALELEGATFRELEWQPADSGLYWRAPDPRDVGGETDLDPEGAAFRELKWQPADSGLYWRASKTLGLGESQAGGFDPAHSTDEPSEPDVDELYEGIVLLTVKADDGIGQIVQFVRDLCRRPDVRLRKMTCSPNEVVEISLALRQPLSLGRILPTIEGVSQVSTSPEPGRAQQRMLIVQLTGRSVLLPGKSIGRDQRESKAERVVA